MNFIRGCCTKSQLKMIDTNNEVVPCTNKPITIPFSFHNKFRQNLSPVGKIKYNKGDDDSSSDFDVELTKDEHLINKDTADDSRIVNLSVQELKKDLDVIPVINIIEAKEEKSSKIEFKSNTTKQVTKLWQKSLSPQDAKSSSNSKWKCKLPGHLNRPGRSIKQYRSNNSSPRSSFKFPNFEEKNSPFSLSKHQTTKITPSDNSEFSFYPSVLRPELAAQFKDVARLTTNLAKARNCLKESQGAMIKPAYSISTNTSV